MQCNYYLFINIRTEHLKGNELYFELKLRRIENEQIQDVLLLYLKRD